MADFKPAYTVFTFVSTHHALKAEMVLKHEGLKMMIIPVPREVSSLCGLAIRVSSDLRSKVEELLRRRGVGLAEIIDYK
jgi:hypothetical protein